MQTALWNVQTLLCLTWNKLTYHNHKSRSLGKEHFPLPSTTHPPPPPPPPQKKCENLFLSNNMNNVKYFAHFTNKIKLKFGFAFLIYEHQYYLQNSEERCQWDRHCIPPSLQVTVTHPWVLLLFLELFFLITVVMPFPVTSIFTYVHVWQSSSRKAPTFPKLTCQNLWWRLFKSESI